MNNDSVLPQTIAMDGISQTVGGLTKREFYAALATVGRHAGSAEELAEISVNIADALLKQLEKTNG